MNSFRLITDGVHVRREPVLDVNSVLIVGDDTALLIDTLSTPAQAGELAGAVREVTGLPIQVVNSHFHFDHTFGNATVAEMLAVKDFWAHPSTIEELSRRGDHVRDGARRICLDLAPEIAEAVGEIELLAPNRPVDGRRTLELGGRQVSLWHPGPAHSPGDLVVLTDAVVVAGDLVEEGAPPNTHGADLTGWVAAVDSMLPHMVGPVVPGHGDIVDAAFVRAQRDELASMALGSFGD